MPTNKIIKIDDNLGIGYGPGWAGIKVDTTSRILQFNDEGTMRTMVSTDQTQTLTNKTFTSPTLTSPAIDTVAFTGPITVGKSGGILTVDSTAADYAAIQSYLNVTETGTDAADIKNIRVQLTSAEALTGKYLKSIYSRVDVLHAVVDGYCFQGSMRVGPNGAPSGVAYGISQSMVLTMSAHTQVTEARCVYASISGDQGINGKGTVYMGVASNTDTTHIAVDAIYEGSVAAFCKATSIFEASGQGTADQIINVEIANGTPALVRFAADNVANCVVAGGSGAATAASGQWRNIKMLIGSTAYYFPVSASLWTNS